MRLANYDLRTFRIGAKSVLDLCLSIKLEYKGDKVSNITAESLSEDFGKAVGAYNGERCNVYMSYVDENNNEVPIVNDAYMIRHSVSIDTSEDIVIENIQCSLYEYSND